MTYYDSCIIVTVALISWWLGWEVANMKYNTGKLNLPGVKFKVIVIHAGFGDATLIEATDNKGESNFEYASIVVILPNTV